MATDRALLTRRRYIGFAVETTTGTAATVAAADAVTKVYNFELDGGPEVEEREALGSGAEDAGVPGARPGRCSFEVPVVGNGATGLPIWASRLLPACGWKATGSTFAWDLTDETTVTIATWEDGYKRMISGARGTFTINLVTGKMGKIRFEFQGKYSADTDDALPSPTLVSVVPPPFQNGTCTFASAAVKLANLSINAGVNVALRENAADAAAYHAAAITACKPTMTADPELQLLATRAWYTSLATPTTEAMNLVVGTAANNVVTIAASALQYTKAGRGDRNGIATAAIEGTFTGASPFTIAFS
jgi:hypothetical protein